MKIHLIEEKEINKRKIRCLIIKYLAKILGIPIVIIPVFIPSYYDKEKNITTYYK